MTDRVPTGEIERIVGAVRHPTDHIARAVSAEQRVYILHSRECLNSVPDLRTCRFSRALDCGINPAGWTEDAPLVVTISSGRLVPRPPSPAVPVPDVTEEKR